VIRITTRSLSLFNHAAPAAKPVARMLGHSRSRSGRGRCSRCARQAQSATLKHSCRRRNCTAFALALRRENAGISARRQVGHFAVLGATFGTERLKLSHLRGARHVGRGCLGGTVVAASAHHQCDNADQEQQRRDLRANSDADHGAARQT
jgi:hypothetical protein